MTPLLERNNEGFRQEVNVQIRFFHQQVVESFSKRKTYDAYMDLEKVYILVNRKTLCF